MRGTVLAAMATLVAMPGAAQELTFAHYLAALSAIRIEVDDRVVDRCWTNPRSSGAAVVEAFEDAGLATIGGEIPEVEAGRLPQFVVFEMRAIGRDVGNERCVVYAQTSTPVAELRTFADLYRHFSLGEERYAVPDVPAVVERGDAILDRRLLTGPKNISSGRVLGFFVDSATEFATRANQAGARLREAFPDDTARFIANEAERRASLGFVDPDRDDPAEPAPGVAP